MVDTWQSKQAVWARLRDAAMRPGQRERAVWRLDAALVQQALRRWAPAPPGRVLDVGTAHLDFAARLPRAWRYVALDPLLLPQVRQGSHGGQLACAMAEALPFAPRTMAAVLFRDSLDHIGDDATALREAGRVLVDGGCVVITLANRGSVIHRLRRVRDRVRGRPGYDHLAQHLRHYDLGDVRALADRSGFALVWARSHAYAVPGVDRPLPVRAVVDRLAWAFDRWCALWLPGRGDKLVAVLQRRRWCGSEPDPAIA